jgi:acetyl esterase/lipase
MSYVKWLATLVVAVMAAGIVGSQPQQPRPKLPDGTKAFRDVEYVKGGHERQRLDLYLPEKADAPLPLIVWVHPGAWTFGSRNDVGSALQFVQKGYAVASVGYRLSQHARFPAQIEDCKAAVRWLRANAKSYNLDSDRVGAWGASSGGHLVALLGTSGGVKDLEGKEGPLDQSSRVQAVVDWFGPTDLLQMGGGHDAADSPESKLIGGPLQENKDKASRANPIAYVTKDTPPFLIMHGDKDPLVPFGQSELLVTALKKAGADVTFRPVKGAGHGGPAFSSEDNLRAVEEFLDKHLKAKK